MAVDVGSSADECESSSGLAPEDDLEMSPAIARKLDSTLTAWRDKLLAMDKRQRLLYFKHLKAGTLEFDHASPLSTLATLASTSVPVRPAPEPGTSRSDRALYVKDKTNETLRSSLRRIDQQSNQAFADRGVWTLYLGVLMLHWTDPNDTSTKIDSPVLLIPVRAEKTGADSPYVISRTDDDITVNPVLQLKLSNEFGVKLPTIDPDDVSLERFRADLEQSISQHPQWRVDSRMVLANFTFQKEAMYQDLLENADRIAGHDMVRLLALGPDSPSSSAYGFDEPPLEGLDERKPPESMFTILDADSSQRRCILCAADGQSFVMDGPPGTGKSQTIANMVAELMAIGKTVLFVSEKAAALDVVRDRLTNEGLQHFLFELHSHAATRKEVAAELSRTLRKRVQIDSTFSGQDERNLARDRHQLTDFASAMNEIDPKLGWSLFTVLGRLSELDRGIDASVPSHRRWASVSEADLAEIRQHASTLGRVWDAVADEDSYLWRDLKSDQLGPAEAREYGRYATRALESARLVRERVAAIDAELDLSIASDVDGIQERLNLLGALDDRPRGVPLWFDCERLDALDERLREAQAGLKAIGAHIEALEAAGIQRWREVPHDFTDVLTRGVEHPLVPSTSTASQLNVLVSTLDTVTSHLATLNQDAADLAQVLGLRTTPSTIEDASDAARLAMLAAEAHRPEPEWLNSAVIARVSECLNVMDAVVEHANRRQDALREVFTPAVLELDLPSLIVRFRETHKGLRRFSGAARADRKLIKSVSVSGRCDKEVLTQLDEAASWQHAVADVRKAEAVHAGQLGSRYQGQSTEFGSLRAALDNARAAMNLAGMDTDSTALAQQLSAHATPDPRLIPLAQRIQSTISSLRSVVHNLPNGLGDVVDNTTPVQTIVDTTADVRTTADSVSNALSQVSSVAERDLTVNAGAHLTANVAETVDLEDRHRSHSDSDKQAFGSLLTDETDFDLLAAGIDNARAVRRLYPGEIDQALARRLAESTATRADLADRVQDNTSRVNEILDLFTSDRAAELRTECEAGIDEQIELMQDMLETASSQIEDWCAAHRELTWAHSLELQSIIGALKRLPRIQSDIQAAIEYVILEAWADSRCETDTRLEDYKASSRDDLVREFQELDRALIGNAKARVVQRCNDRAPVSLAGRAAQVIKREGEKKSRHKPVRELLAETTSLVQQLKPCFMMSPLSVSQYLPSDIRFDVVIFDEASQVLPQDALNCIYRGNQLIVAGDQKQLPPTDFFSVAEDEGDEDNEASDFKSVLDLAKGAGGLHSLPLKWHYRSRHEDLIAYSNHSFYQGDLLTFPSAVFEADDLGIAHIPVDGVYQRGSSRDNPIEAAKIVERVAWFRTNHPSASLGVVTFSGTQADRITQEIEAQSEQNPALEGLLTDHDRLDGFFVKSLENVQGDERDIILFSIGYGPDEVGKFTANFGPLNRDGGWRRLNVAVTRARKRIEIVSSFTAGQMPPTSNPSLLHLQRYLDFAARGHAALAIDVSTGEGGPESVFEEQVLAKIRSWGYDAVPQVGVAGYRIDMAVRHPERPGEYVLGIECDGAAYHSAQTARDRDRLRQQVLEGLGWRMHRIWGLSWWRDRSAQEERLRLAIEDAINGRNATSTPTYNPTTESRSSAWEFSEVPETVERNWTRPYSEYTVRPARTRDPKTLEGIQDMTDFFLNAIRVEAPVHRDLLNDRFKSVWGAARVGHQIRSAIDKALKRAHPAGPDNKGFFRLDNPSPLEVRVPDDGCGERKASQVPSEELELALKQIVLDAVTIDERTLVKQAAGVFGWRRVGADIEDVLGRSIKLLLKTGVLLLDGHGDLSVAKEA
ncbi:DUF3320 domain-containing protein [Gordonia sp. 'Campus']|uniref:DUF3320 domain-containing protein n=1 Tax=Gordonia sp. 'Campus' TaxID=2915824 RepID=UPI001EE48EBA|nr:DUF3320 domain-containing protein [Gordonia sp. 'Campus']